MRKISILTSAFAVLLASLLLPATVYAQMTSEDEIIIDSVVTDNLYVAAEDFTLNARSQADVVVGARRIIINGDVNGNLILAAQEIEINGNVTGDVLGAAGIIVLNGDVTGDARLFAGQAFVNSENIRGDLVVASGRASISEATKVELKNLIAAGNTSLNIIDNPTSLPEVVGTDSQADYFSGLFASTGIVASILGAFISLLFLVGGIVANYLVIRFFPTFTERTLVKMKEDAFTSVMVGLGVFVVSPIVAFVLLITGVGLPILVLLLALGWLAYLFSMAYGNYIVGRIALEQLKFDSTGRLLPLVVGTAIFTIIGLVPVVGWFITGIGSILLSAWAIGAMFMHKWDSIRVNNTNVNTTKKARKGRNNTK